MRILISGGGITGLTLSVLLKRQGIMPLLIERHPKWDHPVGFSIAIMPNGRHILDQLGVANRLDDEGHHIPYYAIADMQGNEIMRKEFSDDPEQYERIVMIDRWKLHQMLRDLAQDVPTRLGVMIASMKQHAQGVTVTFSDGMVEDFDLVVCADGIYSKMRDETFAVKQPDYYGWTSWLFWLDPKIKAPEGVVQMWGTKSFFVCYPCKGRSAAYFAAVNPPHQPDPVETRIDRLKELFKDYGWIVPSLLQTLDKPAEVFHDDLATVHIKEWENGRILLAGDSQHAMTPLLGMGASMAMEDAAVLAEELGALNGKAARIDDALLQYAERRGKRVRHVQNVSGFLWKLAAVESTLLCRVRDATMKHLPSDYVYTPIQGLFQTSI